MNKFVTGMIAGGALMIAGAEFMSMNRSTKRKLMHKGRKLVDKAEDALEDISSEVWQ